MPREWRRPLALDISEMVLTEMGGNWPLFRSLPKRWRARLVATKRVVGMVSVARARDEAVRREMDKDSRAQ